MSGLETSDFLAWLPTPAAANQPNRFCLRNKHFLPKYISLTQEWDNSHFLKKDGHGQCHYVSYSYPAWNWLVNMNLNRACFGNRSKKMYSIESNPKIMYLQGVSYSFIGFQSKTLSLYLLCWNVAYTHLRGPTICWTKRYYNSMVHFINLEFVLLILQYVDCTVDISPCLPQTSQPPHPREYFGREYVFDLQI